MPSRTNENRKSTMIPLQSIEPVICKNQSARNQRMHHLAIFLLLVIASAANSHASTEEADAYATYLFGKTDYEYDIIWGTGYAKWSDYYKNTPTSGSIKDVENLCNREGRNFGLIETVSGEWVTAKYGYTSTGKIPPDMRLPDSYYSAPYLNTINRMYGDCIVTSKSTNDFSIILRIFSNGYANNRSDDPINFGDCTTCSANTIPACAGNPINALTGNKFQKEIDIQQINTATLGFQRYYNSKVSEEANLGVGWRHTYDRKLIKGVAPSRRKN